MSGLGDDFKDVLMEVGVLATVAGVGGVSEYIKTKVNAQVTKPFIREFFLEAELSFDTAVAPGNVLGLPDGRRFIVMNLTPAVFEGLVYKKTAVLYKCNVSGILYRLTSLTVNYKAVASWSIVCNPCYALLTESYYGHELDEDEPVGPVSKKANDCYLSHSVGAMKGDRMAVSPTEYYQVESIMLRRYDNVDLIQLGEDNRGPHI